MKKTLLFLLPIFITGIIYLLFYFSFPHAPGWHSFTMDMTMAVVLILAPIIMGVFIFKLLKKRRALLLYSSGIFLFIFFIEPIEQHETPFSVISRMTYILFTEDKTITSTDMIEFRSLEHRIAAIKKYRTGRLDKRVYQFRVWTIDQHDGFLRSEKSTTKKNILISFKNGKPYTADESIMYSPDSTSLTYVNGAKFKISFIGENLDSTEMKINNWESEDWKNSCGMDVNSDVKGGVSIFDYEKVEEPYILSHFWAYRFFYWLC